MPWYEKDHTTAFETAPLEGLFFLYGDLLAQKYQQNWIKGKKYPVITYPSGLQRELWNSSDEHGIMNIFGAFELLRHSTRDEGFQRALEFASQYESGVAKRGDDELLIFHPATLHGYAVKYDNFNRQIMDVRRFPPDAMELLDIESRAVLPELYSNEALGLDAIAPIKFFTPDSNWTWYPTEYDGEDTFFGLVVGFEVELGYFSLSELGGIRGRLGLPVERDLYFQPASLHTLQQQY